MSDHVGRDGVEVPVYTREDNLVRPPSEAISWADLCAARGSNNDSTNSPHAGPIRADTQVGPYDSNDGFIWSLQAGAGNVTRVTLRFNADDA